MIKLEKDLMKLFKEYQLNLDITYKVGHETAKLQFYFTRLWI